MDARLTGWFWANTGHDNGSGDYLYVARNRDGAYYAFRFTSSNSPVLLHSRLTDWPRDAPLWQKMNVDLEPPLEARGYR